jgi:ketosteroid isomerase-like protein
MESFVLKSIDIFVFACVTATLMGCAAVPIDTAGERARLLALHEQAMEAHRKGDVELLLQADDADFVLASRGEISRPSLEQRRQFFGTYLRGVRFAEYIDVVAPVVHVSADGTAGWVIVQVRARGTEVGGSGRSLQFESAWIELYEKRGDGWRRVGNVSNFK